MILHHIDASGGLTAGDTTTGVTAYAYPTSHYAMHARTNPEHTAAAMIRAAPLRRVAPR